MNEMQPSEFYWWQKGIIYQIYPRSYKDSDGDGIGDLRGIIDKLDYLQWLGVSAIWISPIYPSPMDDMGYDISDYIGIHPMFGTMGDFDELLEQSHNRNLRVILDLVPNHTSYQHSWFQESRSSKDNPKRDWYIWRDPAPDGGPPNNWQSVFGGSGWEYDKETGQYFYHAFLKQQPDLNWRNPDVQEAMLDVMRFWLDKGIDGFRVDVIWHMIKDYQFRNNPPNPDYNEGMPDHDRYIASFSEDQPIVHEIIADMRKVIDSYDKKLIIGEIYLPINKLVTYYGKENTGVHLPFNFQLIQLDNWNAETIYTLINEYEGSLPPGGWPNWVLGNHDKSRIAARVGIKQARIAAVLLLTLRGTPTIYYGEEIGMDDVDIPADKVTDPANANVPGYARDPERTPMQWDNSRNAGFSEAEPWLPIAPDFEQMNVKQEKNDPASMLTLYKKLIALRQEEPALHVGDFFAEKLERDLMVYHRSFEGSAYMIALNFGKQSIVYRPDQPFTGVVKISTANDSLPGETVNELELESEEAYVVELKNL